MLHLRRDPTGTDETLWVWLYDSPIPPPPTPGPPPDPCNPPDGGGGPDITSGKAFRIGDGLLVDLAVRQYKLFDAPEKTMSNWNGFTAGTTQLLVSGISIPFPVGKWLFDNDLQMKDYRGEITIVDAPSLGEKLDNPYGDWGAGPGQWYLRARDKLSIILYTGDLYMGNTGNGYHVPLTNGIFSTLAAIYNITWP